MTKLRELPNQFIKSVLPLALDRLKQGLGDVPDRNLIFASGQSLVYSFGELVDQHCVTFEGLSGRWGMEIR